jgi:hypothetical protein
MGAEMKTITFDKVAEILGEKDAGKDEKKGARKGKKIVKNPREKGARKLIGKRRLTRKQILFSRFVTIAESENQAAVSAGYSPASSRTAAYDNMRNPAVIEAIEVNFKEHLRKAGLGDDVIAAKYADFVNYNSEKITKVDAMGNEYTEMRNAAVGAKVLSDITKLSNLIPKDQGENGVMNGAVLMLDSNTSRLAILQLLDKVDDDALREIEQRIRQALASRARPMNDVIDAVVVEA